MFLLYGLHTIFSNADLDLIGDRNRTMSVLFDREEMPSSFTANQRAFFLEPQLELGCH